VILNGRPPCPPYSCWSGTKALRGAKALLAAIAVSVAGVPIDMRRTESDPANAITPRPSATRSAELRPLPSFWEPSARRLGGASPVAPYIVPPLG